ncbi:Ankyrin repeat protein [Aphelenchoides besseyi]|nr:Ankyrin repeat protein [Aphelenchoides besseyi]
MEDVTLENESSAPIHHHNIQDKQGKTLLIHSAAKGQLSIIEELSLNENIDVNIADNEGNCALHHASAAGHARVVQALIDRFPKLKIDKANVLGMTALMKAAIQGRVSCARALLKAGADPYLRDYSRQFCALQWAEYVGRRECAQVIADHMLEPCKQTQSKLSNASNNLKQVACLVAIPIMSGDQLPALPRPRVRSAPHVPTVKVKIHSAPNEEKSLITPIHRRVTRPSSSMA